MASSMMAVVSQRGGLGTVLLATALITVGGCASVSRAACGLDVLWIVRRRSVHGQSRAGSALWVIDHAQRPGRSSLPHGSHRSALRTAIATFSCPRVATI